MVDIRLNDDGTRALLFLVLLASPACGFELPDPPNLRPLNDEYENPTADLGPERAEDFIEKYASHALRLERTGNLRDVRRLAGDFDDSVTVTGEGETATVEIDGVPVSTDALITLRAECPTGAASATQEDIVGQVVVRDSKVVPTIWGELDDCTIDPGPDPLIPETTVSGNVSVFIPTLLSDDAEPVYLIEYDISRIVVDGTERRPMSGHARFVADLPELLLGDDDGASVVVFGGATPAIVGVRAANGRWQCWIEERRCEAQDASGSSFSY